MYIDNIKKPQRISGESVSMTETDPLYIQTMDLHFEAADVAGTFNVPCDIKLPLTTLQGNHNNDIVLQPENIITASGEYKIAPGEQVNIHNPLYTGPDSVSSSVNNEFTSKCIQVAASGTFGTALTVKVTILGYSYV